MPKPGSAGRADYSAAACRANLVSCEAERCEAERYSPLPRRLNTATHRTIHAITALAGSGTES
jgi:hypothetical protein